jgi:hypothetical protein
MLNCTGFASISYLKRSGNMVRNFTKW